MDGPSTTVGELPSVSRLRPLDSLRGIAALAVAIGHCLYVFVVGGVPDVELARFQDLGWTTWPIRVFHGVFNGLSAVAIFFVLSGYVLSLALAKHGSLPAYAARRFARLWPPLIAGVLVSWLVINLVFFSSDDASLFGYFMRHSFDAPPTLGDVWKNLTLLDTPVDKVTWTIVVEVWGSAVLPLILFGMNRFGPTSILVGLAVLSIVCPTIASVVWLFAFGAGAWLATRPKLPRGHWSLYLLFGWSLLIMEANVHGGAGTIIIGYSLGAAGVLVAILKTQPGWMTIRPLLLLGDISYSFYLLHFPLLYLAVSLANRLGLSDVGGTLFTIVVSIGLTIPAAVLSRRYIELPSMAAMNSWLRKRSAIAAI